MEGRGSLERLEYKRFRAVIAEEELPGRGRKRIFRVEAPNAVVVLPLYTSGEVVLLRQYRPAVGEWIIEAPAGTVEEGEDPLETARRELREETGLIADRLELVAEGYVSPGYSTEYMYFYLAWDPIEAEASPEEDEVLAPFKVRIEEALDMLARREIRDVKTALILLLAKSKLG